MTVETQAVDQRSGGGAALLIGVGLIVTVTWTAALSLGAYMAVAKLVTLVI
jgi:hypothetical protein